VSDAADVDDALPVLVVGEVEWNLMNDNPYEII